ncbi:MAG: phage tail protein [Promethearchaeota archaeon]
MPKMRSKARLGNVGTIQNSISYSLEIEGVAVFTIDSISGLGIETQVVEYTDGDNPLTHKRPGRFTYNNITVHNISMTDATPLYNWVELAKSNASSGSLANTSKIVAIVMFEGSTEVRRWNCFGCFPASFTYHTMEPNKPLYADMVIAVERFETA